MKAGRKFFFAVWAMTLFTILILTGIVGAVLHEEWGMAMIFQGIGGIGGDFILYCIANISQKKIPNGTEQ